MKTNKKILMICYYYPPLRDVGCKRSYYFSKYLKKYGWEPFVLSVKNPDKTYCNIGDDSIPENIKVEYSYSLINITYLLGKINGILTKFLKIFHVKLRWDFMYGFAVPDVFFGWIPHTVLKSLRIIKDNDIKIVFATITPFSSALIGVLLKKITKNKLILDFRDPIALKKNIGFQKKNFIRRKTDLFLEKFALKNCDVFTVTTEATKNAYIEQYPFIKEKIHTIHNGFDPDILPKKNLQKFEKFTIIYTGDFYFFSEKNIKYSKAFFQALSNLKEENKISYLNFQFLFYGDNIKAIIDYAKKFNIEDLVIARKRKPYDEILQIISQSHAVLLKIISELTISTKLLEGIALKVPIIATIPKGDASELIERYSKNSFIISEYSNKQIENAILSLINKYKTNSLVSFNNEEFTFNFSRENLTKKLLLIIEGNCVENGNIF